jgi:protein phosphatase
MKVTIPELALVVLIGPSGSGKSTFARQHFLPTEVLSSDYCRGLVSDDENNQVATNDAFEVLHFIMAKRLKAGKLTVVDATNVQPEARKPLIALAREYHCLPVALVLDMPETICRDRNKARTDRNFGDHVIRNQRGQLHRSMRGLAREGFRHVHVFRSPEDLVGLEIVRQPLWNNKKTETGPFDIIGDIHGCFDEAVLLLNTLGYSVSLTEDGYSLSHPEGRKAVFVGDLVDRGPKTPDVIRLVMSAVHAGTGYCVAGNHDVKLSKALRGKDVKLTHGLAESMQQLETHSEQFKSEAADFLNDLVSHYVFDGGKLVVAHAGLREEMHGRGSGKVREFAMYGETTGEADDFGLPVRYNWAADYRGRAMVVYGHTPVPEAEWLNNTICVDTGCVFGGKLTALRYPERELVSVPAVTEYYKSIKPLQSNAPQTANAQHLLDDVLDLEDVTGKRIIDTKTYRSITIREENAVAALEVMSRFAANPKWLIYLPPAISPPETSNEPNLLEHPAEAFGYYKSNGITNLVCEEKHMGSRAVIIICQDEKVVKERFGIVGEGIGIIYTRTGRRFFSDSILEQAVLQRLKNAIDHADLWPQFNTKWFCLDCEIMPWSVKAQDLILKQYAAVGASATAALDAESNAIKMALANGIDVSLLDSKIIERKANAQNYIEAYRRYCWEVGNIDDLKIAPFHLLASEGKVHTDMPHKMHMDIFHKLATYAPNWLVATSYIEVDLTDDNSIADAVSWWTALTQNGGEGMVVKPSDFIVRGKRGLLQPAVKCRGPEYLRIIYGPDYSNVENLVRLRQRGLATKRSMALREFALGIEGLTRFVSREPLRRTHECVFGVLAMESEPVDPRL